MQELTLIQKYDEVLKALYDISGQRPTFGRILALLRVRKVNMEWAEVWDIMAKMRREFIIHPEITDRSSKIPTEVIHLITFEGKLMYERKGLKGKIKRETFTERRVNALSYLTLLLAIGTLYYTTKSVSDDTLNKVNDTLKESQLQLKSLSESIKDTAHRNRSPVQNICDTSLKKQTSLNPNDSGLPDKAKHP